MAGNRRASAVFQTVLELIYPSCCLTCDEQVETSGALCGNCWRETPFIQGLVCDLCGTPLPGEAKEAADFCDDCLRIARPWRKGRCALVYKGNGRKMVMALKHGDRHEIASIAGVWLNRTAQPMLENDSILVPVPLHWTRFFKRRFNQSALLAQAIARSSNLPYHPDLLHRHKRTVSLDGLSRDERFARLSGVISPSKRGRRILRGRSVLLVDDVMTSGATLAASAEACRTAGAKDICVLALARVVKDA